MNQIDIDRRCVDLDLRIPMHSEAFLLAASHILSSWPQDWTAEELALALLADDDDSDELLEKQKRIIPWESILVGIHPMDNSMNVVYDYINNIAEDFVTFAHRHA